MNSRLLVAVFVLAVCSAAASTIDAVAQTCVDYTERVSWLGNIRFSGAADVVVTGETYLYVLNDGLRVVDASDPTHLEPLHFVSGPGSAGEAVIVGSHLFVLSYAPYGLDIYDISVPTAATLVSTYPMDLAGGVHNRHLGVVEDVAFIANVDSLHVVDVSDPLAPTALQIVPIPELWDLQVAGDYLYTAHEDGALVTYDVSDPMNLIEVSSVGSMGDFTELHVDGSTIYACSADPAELQVYVRSQPDAPKFLASAPSSANPINGMRRDGSFLIVPAVYGFMKFDVSGSAPVEVYYMRYPNTFLRDGALMDGVLYVAAGELGVDAYDTRRELGPAPLIGSLGLSSAKGIEVRDGLAYVATGDGGISVVDVSVPSTPVERSFFNLPGHQSRLDLEGDRAYLASGVEGIIVVNVANPDGIFFSGITNTSGNTREVDVDGDYGYAADGTGGLKIFDVAVNPDQPIEIASVSMGTGLTAAVRKSGDYAYALQSPFGLRIVDVSDPLAPTLVGSFDTESSAIEFDLVGDRAYVVDRVSTGGYRGWLHVIDVSDPTNPVLLGTTDEVPYCWDVDVEGDVAYVAGGLQGTTMVDVSNPTDMTVLGTVATVEETLSLVVEGELVYAVQETLNGLESGIYIVPAQCPTVASVEAATLAAVPSIRLLASPNPFARSTDLVFELDRADQVRLEIYDVGGRRVRSLVDGRLETGRHAFRWDGTGDHGEALARGIYFLRLTRDGGEDVVQRLALLR